MTATEKDYSALNKPREPYHRASACLPRVKNGGVFSLRGLNSAIVAG